MTQERWNAFSKRDQLLMIGSEFERARVWEQDQRGKEFLGALERALNLIAFARNDPKWDEEMAQIIGLEEEVKTFQSGNSRREVAILYRML